MTNNCIHTCLKAIICLLFTGGAIVLTPVNVSANLDNTTYINANEILMFVTNRSTFSRDLEGLFGNEVGTYYPYISIEAIESGAEIKSPLYAAGIWIGGKVNSEIRVSAAEFDTEFWLGPMIGNSFDSTADTDAAYRVYKLYSDSMGNNPNTDYTEWPISDGAPVDNFGNPLLLGDQTLWSVYTDANPATQIARLGLSEPLGVEIQHTTWAEDRPDRSRIICMAFKLYNKGLNEITDFHIGLWLDTDLGTTHDDLTGCDSSDGIFYCYNADDSDAVYGIAPPAIGARLVYGPVVESPGDTAVFDRHLLQGHQNLEMSSYVSYVNGIDPQNGAEAYNYMTGFQADSSQLPNGTKFSYPGDPVTNTGDLELNPGNRHMIGSFGPINFIPGDSQFVMIKIGVGQGTDNLVSLTNLREILLAPDSLITDAPDEEAVQRPIGFRLSQNYPNPFNPSTVIDYYLPYKSRVLVTVHNILGRRIATLTDDLLPRGSHSATWNGEDTHNIRAASGVYFYRIKAGNYTQSKQMLLLK